MGQGQVPPLALRVAGALIEYEHFLDFNVKQLISDLQENFRSLDSSDYIDEATGRTATIGMLFRRSILTLPQREQEAFACIGGFAPKPATVNLRAMTNLCGLAEPEKTVRILVGRGLLEPRGDGRFQMHYTLAMYARHLVDTELSELSS